MSADPVYVSVNAAPSGPFDKYHKLCDVGVYAVNPLVLNRNITVDALSSIAFQSVFKSQEDEIKLFSRVLNA